MHLLRLSLILTFVCTLCAPGIAVAAPSAQLAAPPLGERWFGITVGDERTGFAHTSMAEATGGYEILSEGSARMVVMGFTREASSRESYLINRDLSLKSFAVDQTIGGTATRLKGEVTARGVKVTVIEGGKRREKTLKGRGKVYPGPVLNLYPLVHGATPGKTYHVQMLDPEDVKLKEVTITVVGRETLPGGVETVHLRNDLYPFVDNDVWVDLAGNTVRESVRDGLIVTSVEDAAAARKVLVEAAVNQQELLRDFSLVRPDRPLTRPADLKAMTVELSGLPAAATLFTGSGQQALPLGEGRALVTVTRGTLPPSGAVAPEENGHPEATGGAKAPDQDELAAAASKILAGEQDPRQEVEKLVRWTAATLEDGATEHGSPLGTLRAKKGTCLSRTRLYVALARAAGIPTRLVAGLVYVAGKGFLYHCWAESRVNGWLAVDPCGGQVPADATHVKLTEGDTPEAMAPLAGLIGRIAVKVIGETY